MGGRKLIIFDYDGTVVLSFSVFKESLRELLRKLRLEQAFRESELEYMAKSAPKTWLPKLLSKIPSNRKPKPEAVLETFKEIYSKIHLNLIKAVPNVHDVLRKLKRKGYMLALTTGRVLVSDFVPIELKHLKLDNLFDLVYVPNRPDKLKTVKEIIEKLSVEDAVIVGDSVDDIKAGKALSLKTIAVLYGFTSKKELLKHKPDYTINKIDELLTII